MVVAMENALYYFTCFFHNYFTIFFTSSCKNLEGIFLGSSSWEPHRELGHKIQQSLEDPSTSTILFVRIFTEMSLSAHGSGGFSSKPRWADLSCSSWLRGDRFPERSMAFPRKTMEMEYVGFFLIVGIEVMETKLFVPRSWSWKFDRKMCTSPMHLDLH